jgi:hypothetical protein
VWESLRERGRERERERGRRGFPSSAFTSSDFAFSNCVTVFRTMRPIIRPRIYIWALRIAVYFFCSLRFRAQEQSFGQSRRGSGREREWEVGAVSVAVERKTEMRSGKRQSIPSPPRLPPPTLVSLHPSMVFRLPPTIRRPLRIPTTVMIMMMMVEAFTNKNPNSSNTINSR